MFRFVLACVCDGARRPVRRTLKRITRAIGSVIDVGCGNCLPVEVVRGKECGHRQVKIVGTLDSKLLQNFPGTNAAMCRQLICFAAFQVGMIAGRSSAPGVQFSFGGAFDGVLGRELPLPVVLHATFPGGAWEDADAVWELEQFFDDFELLDGVQPANLELGLVQPFSAGSDRLWSFLSAGALLSRSRVAEIGYALLPHNGFSSEN